MPRINNDHEIPAERSSGMVVSKVLPLVRSDIAGKQILIFVPNFRDEHLFMSHIGI
ncbi:hypothetical protein [Methanospirillum lacunae]|uniref:hypothetical protein n=1 Tax=Methanospirillum lacunae TaxID=668570 RepID=UPI0015E82EEB|nr:hypothetical protein [Methanospirillum lacunae]